MGDLNLPEKDDLYTTDLTRKQFISPSHIWLLLTMLLTLYSSSALSENVNRSTYNNSFKKDVLENGRVVGQVRDTLKTVFTHPRYFTAGDTVESELQFDRNIDNIVTVNAGGSLNAKEILQKLDLDLDPATEDAFISELIKYLPEWTEDSTYSIQSRNNMDNIHPISVVNEDGILKFCVFAREGTEIIPIYIELRRWRLRKMVKTKYGQYIKSFSFQDYGPGRSRQGTELTGEFLGYDVNVQYGAFWSAGKIGRAPYQAEVSNYDQILIFMIVKLRRKLFQTQYK